MMGKISSFQVCVSSRITYNKPYCVLFISCADDKNKCKAYQMEWPNDMDCFSACPVMPAELGTSLCPLSAQMARPDCCLL